MDQAVREYDVVDVYEECVPAKADPVDWYKWGRPHRAYRPRTIRYVSAKKVSDKEQFYLFIEGKIKYHHIFYELMSQTL